MQHFLRLIEISHTIRLLDCPFKGCLMRLANPMLHSHLSRSEVRCAECKPEPAPPEKCCLENVERLPAKPGSTLFPSTSTPSSVQSCYGSNSTSTACLCCSNPPLGTCRCCSQPVVFKSSRSVGTSCLPSDFSSWMTTCSTLAVVQPCKTRLLRL